MTEIRTAPAVDDQLALVQDYLLGNEGIWIDEDEWRERATYEADTNAWTDDPYDRVPSAEIAADGCALAEAIVALEALTPMDGDDEDLLRSLQADGMTFARALVDTEGRPRRPDGWFRSVPEIAEELHSRWGELEEIWLARTPVGV